MVAEIELRQIALQVNLVIDTIDTVLDDGEVTLNRI
jgi:hypothetical protein